MSRVFYYLFCIFYFVLVTSICIANTVSFTVNNTGKIVSKTTSTWLIVMNVILIIASITLIIITISMHIHYHLNVSENISKKYDKQLRHTL